MTCEPTDMVDLYTSDRGSIQGSDRGSIQGNAISFG